MIRVDATSTSGDPYTGDTFFLTVEEFYPDRVRIELVAAGERHSKVVFTADDALRIVDALLDQVTKLRDKEGLL